jgi:hypothetical protein
MPAASGPAKTKENRMKRLNYSFLSGESTVAAAVTTVVCAWFLVAAAAILTDPASPYTTRAQRAAPAGPVAIAPEARLTITVEAHRG